MRLTWLAHNLRAAGLKVVEVPGWETRESGSTFRPKVLIDHHTASGRYSGDHSSLPVLLNGRPDLPPPIAQILISRNATVYVVAAGRCNQAGRGGWTAAGTYYGGNVNSMGIEAENDGRGEPWSKAVLDAYIVTNAVCLKGLGRDTRFLCGHLEWAPTRKSDPAGFSMNWMRGQVKSLMATGRIHIDSLRSEEDMTPSQARQLQDCAEQVAKVRASASAASFRDKLIVAKLFGVESDVQAAIQAAKDADADRVARGEAPFFVERLYLPAGVGA